MDVDSRDEILKTVLGVVLIFFGTLSITFAVTTGVY